MNYIVRFCALLLATAFLSGADAEVSPLVVLAQESPNATAWVLSPLDKVVPAIIRENLTLLREALLDEGKTSPRTSLNAYRSGYQLCNGLIAALDERDKSLVGAGMAVTQTQITAAGSTQEMKARRNYLMSWPQYHQEEANAEQQKDRVLNAISVTNNRQNDEWKTRTAQMRIGLDANYSTYRDVLRADPVIVQALAEPRPQVSVFPKADSASGVSSLPPSSPASKAIPLPASAYTNSLGMVFVPVDKTNVLFCIHETRRSDYSTFSEEAPGVSPSWKAQKYKGIPCGHEDDHPVSGIKWSEAVAFCEWLSKKEGKKYRLPTDREWSHAVGIGHLERWTRNSTPRSMNNLLLDYFPWGKNFPPETPDLAGNYADLMLNSADPEAAFLPKYSDGFVTTSPVMSFKPNKFGIYDLGGNVQEWCMEWFDETSVRKFTRGGSWANNTRENLLSANRFERSPEIGYQIYLVGFRCVIEAP